jgi:hypothetical protein
MPKQVVNGAMCQCTMGMAPSSLVVLPTNMVSGEKVPKANIMDFIPMTNIMPFGMCQSPANPTVASATAAALGVLTPMPCIPATVAPWTPGAAQTTVAKMPALQASDTCMCMWGGSISITNPGQTSIDVK